VKPATAALQAYLTTNDTVEVIDLYTFSLADGQVLRYADYPLPSVTVPAINFPGSPLNYAATGNQVFYRGPKFGRSKVSTKIGVEPAELKVEIYPSPADLIGDFSWGSFIELGGFDGATCELDRFFMPTQQDGIVGPMNTSLGAVVWFYGRTANIDIERSKISITVKALINLLQQQQMPRRLFQSGCTHVFGDAMCGYNRTLGENALGTPTGVGAVAVAAQTGSTQGVVISASGIGANYVQGTLTCNSGANAGFFRGIQQISGTSITMTKPWPAPVAHGDTFTALPGCDHTSATCNNVFQNLLRYGGFDYVPPPELAV
jgi:uncharacterized phage protein (TIGR02218 family)